MSRLSQTTEAQDEPLDRLQLTMIAYGSSVNDPMDDSRFSGYDQRRVEIQSTPLVPANILGNVNALTPWAQNVARNLCMDIKHSQDWHCEFCDKLARETSMNFASWLHLTPPKLNVYMHLVCDAEDGPCANRMKGIETSMAMMSGAAQHHTKPYIPKDGIVFPAAASCVYCMSEDTINKPLSRCGKCKLTRYCGVECQRQDWPRHKKSCKLFKDIKWVWT